MRLSDLFKQPDPSRPASTPSAPAPALPVSLPPITPRPPAASTPPPAAPPAVTNDTAYQLFQRLRTEMHSIVERIQREEQVPAEPLLALLTEVVQSVAEQEEVWVGFAHLENSAEPFVVTHPVNVTILALAIARGLGYTTAKSHELAVKAYLHDLGMIKLAGLAEQPRPLTKAEIDALQQHPAYTAELIEKHIPGVGRGICYAILQEHERVGGGGYPANLHNGEIEQDMRIIGMVDVYEALTHHRSWRDRLTPRQAIEHMLSPQVKTQFDPVVLRLLVTQIGVYPAGTWVTLSTGESGRVVRNNPQAPLRPVVDVMLDGHGNTLPHPRRLALVEHPTIFIKESSGHAAGP